MILVGKQQLQDFKANHPDAQSSLDSWEQEVKEAIWKNPHEVKGMYPKVSLPGKGQAIFDICWNKYRLWVEIAYQTKVVLIKKIGTHKEYDKWDIK
jgi:mRNA interferase HigB